MLKTTTVERLQDLGTQMGNAMTSAAYKEAEEIWKDLDSEDREEARGQFFSAAEEAVAAKEAAAKEAAKKAKEEAARQAAAAKAAEEKAARKKPDAKAS